MFAFAKLFGVPAALIGGVCLTCDPAAACGGRCGCRTSCCAPAAGAVENAPPPPADHSQHQAGTDRQRYQSGYHGAMTFQPAHRPMMVRRGLDQFSADHKFRGMGW